MAKPTLTQAISFSCKSKILQMIRTVSNLAEPLPRYRSAPLAATSPVLSENRSSLWNTDNPLEHNLTVGKVQNLRVACQALNGIIIPSNQLFSFWKIVGRITKRKGYVVGRELREGCIIPTIGGGLCQLSNALYDAALKAQFTIHERHAHSRVIKGSLAEQNRDATVFWNYVDLRFSTHQSYQIEARISSSELIVRFLHKGEVTNLTTTRLDDSCQRKIKKADILGNCHSCGVTSCFRNQQQSLDSISSATTTALVDAYTPEFDRYLGEILQPEDCIISPINGRKYKAPAYAWDHATSRARTIFTTVLAIRRSLKLRNIPKQGRALQSTLLTFDKKLAIAFSKRIPVQSTHLIVSQNLLPHLYQLGCLGGRTYDVLMTRLPLATLQATLDSATEANPSSPTISDFRASQELLDLENSALKQARKLITPHAMIASLFAENALLLDWNIPKFIAKNNFELPDTETIKLYFPASPLARKGIYQLCESIQELETPSLKIHLLVLGKATEGSESPLEKISWSQASIDDLDSNKIHAVILPAYVDHSPRLLLKAIAIGIPIIATKASGLHGFADREVTIIDSLEQLTQSLAKIINKQTELANS